MTAKLYQADRSVAQLANGTRGYVLQSGVLVPDWAPIARKNALINGDMTVHQRLAVDSGVLMVDNTYQGPDRWRSLSGYTAGTAATVIPSSSGPTGGSARALASLSNGGTGKHGYVSILPYIESFPYRSKPVSLQFKIAADASVADIRAGILSWTGTADAVSADLISAWNTSGTNPTLIANWAFSNTPAANVPSASWQTIKIENIVLGGSLNNLGIFIWSDDDTITNGQTWYLSDIQLEIGVVCTEFERVHIGAKTLECQRYAWVLDVDTATDIIAVGHCYGTQNAVVPIKFPTTMRVTPTMTPSAASHFSLWGGAATAIACTSLSINRATPEIATLDAAIGSASLADLNPTILAANNIAAKMTFSAEL